MTPIGWKGDDDEGEEWLPAKALEQLITPTSPLAADFRHGLARTGVSAALSTSALRLRASEYLTVHRPLVMDARL
jgi:hypothetical protein